MGTIETIQAFYDAVEEFYEEHAEDFEKIRLAMDAKFIKDVCDIVAKNLKERNDEVLQHKEN